MRAVRRGLQGAGIAVENSKGEWGPGQEEINVRYSDALDMADNHAILKNGVKEIAHGLGKAVTFMAKWNYGLAGSSSHIHASLWDAAGKTPLFFAPKAEFTMSPLMRSYVAGQLAYARDITYFLAPYINSYKRFQVGTFAPTKAIWSRDNRTAGFRLCGEGSKAIRIECRIGGADLNPYLAFSALIAAGLAGIEEKLTLDAPFSGDAYFGKTLPEVPKTLREATQCLAESKLLREAFGDAVVDTVERHVPNLKRAIIGRQVLTPADIERITGLSEGNIFQGELALHQLFFLRPLPAWGRYRTPIRGYWQCGAGTHPGGGIMGASGRLAALEILGRRTG
jgi:glutamine synthetase